MQPTNHTVAILRLAREIITESNAWCKRDYAQDAYGKYVHPTDVKAEKWDACGAIVLAEKDILGKIDHEDATEWVIVMNYIDRVLLRMRQSLSLSIYNDSHSHEEVLSLFDSVVREVESCLS